MQEISYSRWHEGDAQSDLWVGSANFYLPLEFSVFQCSMNFPCSSTASAVIYSKTPADGATMPCPWPNGANAWCKNISFIPCSIIG